jgi:hypothetical protein
VLFYESRLKVVKRFFTVVAFCFQMTMLAIPFDADEAYEAAGILFYSFSRF